ncbi:MAG: ABC transporter permease [Erysipelotrichaceae bacterium]
MKTSSISKTKKILIIAFWLALWQIVATIYNKPIIFPSLSDCLASFAVLITQKTFYVAVFSTLTKSLLGLILAYFFAISLAFLCYKHNLLFEMVNPLIQLVKATPVSSIIIFILVFSSSNYLSSIISFIVVFPVVFYCCLNGFKSCDKGIVELAEVFELSFGDKAFYIWRILLTPYLQSISDSTVSLALKSAVACELIGLTANSIGLQFYYCKLNLQNSELICYSFVIVLSAFLIEKGLKLLINSLGGCHD